MYTQQSIHVALWCFSDQSAREVTRVLLFDEQAQAQHLIDLQ